jgi:hypothetical protein
MVAIKAQEAPLARLGALAIAGFGRHGLLCGFVLDDPAQASEIGRVTVMKQGHYWCETPGDALGKAGIRHPMRIFHPPRLDLWIG